MRALMYADWTIVRRVFLRYLLITMFVMTPIVVMGNNDGELAAGTAVVTMCVMMMTIYLTLSIFSFDTSNDWEQFRLALPISTHQVVRSRYAFAALTSLGTVILGSALGVLVELVLPLIHGSIAAPRGFVIIFLAGIGASLVGLLFLSIEMPIVFHLGIEKARMAISIPFMLCMLFTIGPVRDALISLLNKLERVEAALGTPAPLFAGGACAVILVYLASMRLSEHLYANREF